MSRIPDNFDLYDRYERDQIRQEKHFPKCEICGEPMYEYQYHIRHGLIDLVICDSCVEDAREYIEEE